MLPLSLITKEMPEEISAVLYKRAEEVEFPLTEEVQDFIAALKKETVARDAAGFAAPQFGYSFRILAYRIEESYLKVRQDVRRIVPLTILLNPTYEAIEEAGTALDWEFCFSIESEGGKVIRPAAVNIKAWDEKEELLSFRVDGFEARLLQHEIDHLDGLLCDRLYPLGNFYGPREDMMKIRKEEIDQKLALAQG